MCLGYCFAMIEGVWCAVVARFLRIGQCMYGRLLHACQGDDEQVLIGVQQGYPLTTLPLPNALPPCLTPFLTPPLPYLSPFLTPPALPPFITPPPARPLTLAQGSNGGKTPALLKENSPDELILYNKGSH